MCRRNSTPRKRPPKTDQVRIVCCCCQLPGLDSILDGRGRPTAPMRIIAGKYRSRRLAAPAGVQTRPTSDRLRETLFNVLGASVEGSVWLDLFAGSGAVGIEALSRGASMVHFVEHSRRAAELIGANLASLGIEQGFRI